MLRFIISLILLTFIIGCGVEENPIIPQDNPIEKVEVDLTYINLLAGRYERIHQKVRVRDDGIEIPYTERETLYLSEDGSDWHLLKSGDIDWSLRTNGVFWSATKNELTLPGRFSKPYILFENKLIIDNELPAYTKL